jgi:N-methylhydantoinase A
MWIAEQWHDQVPVFAMEDLAPGHSINGPAAVKGAFTTVIVAPGEVATTTPQGDIVIDL